ncbi:MAG: PP2C family protein-serine/threonine phosphatase [Sandaracinaceae bacterium]
MDEGAGANEDPDTTLPNLRPLSRREGHRRAWDVCGQTSVGGRQRNEDHFLVAELHRLLRVKQTSVQTATQQNLDGAGTLLVIADGMGGEGSGDLASAVTVDGIAGHVLRSMPWKAGVIDEAHRKELLEGFGQAACAVQARMRKVADRKRASPRLGTTLTMAFLTRDELYLAHVGDSRAYLLRGGALRRLTRDHTLAAQAEERAPEAGAAFAHLSHVLLNAIGGSSDDVRVESHWLHTLDGDRLLLCTDGLYGAVSDDMIADILRTSERASQACHRLIDTALAEETTDNTTVLVAF